MDELALAVRCTKRTVYSYFPGKQELFLEIVRRAFSALNDRVAERLRDDGKATGLDRIMGLGKALFDSYRERPGMFTLIADFENRETDFTNPGATAAACYREGERLMTLLQDILVQGKRDGSIGAGVAVGTTAVLLWSFLSGLISTLAKKKEYLDRAHGLQPEKILVEAYRFAGLALRPQGRQKGRIQ